MPMTFENSPVVINTASILASNASISIDNPRRGIKALGLPGFASQVSDGPVVGTISASFFATDNVSDIRDLFGAGAGLAAQTFDVQVGTTTCTEAVMNSMSISIEPYTPITCDVNMSFYGGYSVETAGSAPAVPDGVMHGGESTLAFTAAEPLWGADTISCTYSLNQSVNPVYLLGSMSPAGFSIEDQTTEVALGGTGLGAVVAFDDLCPEETKGTITLAGVCGSPPADNTIEFTGYIINPSITVEPNKEINGSLTVFATF